jgi:hypothetical protein
MSEPVDCVQMKQHGADHVRSLTRGMTRDQLRQFWAERDRQLLTRNDAAKARPTGPNTAGTTPRAA